MAKSDEDLQAYIDELRKDGNKSRAARAAGMTFETAKRWERNDEQFAEAVSLAMEEAAYVLEAEATRRAVEGVSKAVFHNGVRVDDGKVIQYSDALLSKLLDGAMPHKYAQRVKSEISGPDGGPVKLEDETSAAARIASMLESARQRKANVLSDDDELLN